MIVLRRNLLVALLIISMLLIICFLNGYHLWIFDSKYGKEYNPNRILVGQPIIEDYFTEDPVKGSQSRSWSAAGSNKYSHVGKFYHVDLFGDMEYEIDYYEPTLDSAWLSREVGGMDTSPPIKDLRLISYKLARTYYPKSGSISFELALNFGNGLLFSHQIAKSVGDSIYSTVR